MIRFACPGCRAACSAPDEAAGRQTVCRHCRQPLSVPVPVVAGEVLPPLPRTSAAVLRTLWILYCIFAGGVLLAGVTLINEPREYDPLKQIRNLLTCCLVLATGYTVMRGIDRAIRP